LESAERDSGTSRQDALEALRRAADLLPQDAEAQRNLGAALHDRASGPEALASLRKGLEMEPNDVQSLVDAANALRALRRPSESVRSMSGRWRSIRGRRRPTTTWATRIWSFAAMVRRFDCYRRALELKPRMRRFCATWPTRCAPSGAARKPSATTGGRSSSTPPTWTPSTASATCCAISGTQRSLALYVRALELDPSRPESHCNLGTLLFELRRVEEAVQCYRSALQLQPSHAPAHLNLAVAAAPAAAPGGGRSTCRAALALDRTMRMPFLPR